MNMETIFDHGVTDSELELLFGEPMTRDAFQAMGFGEDSNNGMLFHLYSFRNDDVTAQKFLSRIKDPQYQADLSTVDILM